jgi:hypothetical protein
LAASLLKARSHNEIPDFRAIRSVPCITHLEQALCLIIKRSNFLIPKRPNFSDAILQRSCEIHVSHAVAMPGPKKASSADNTCPDPGEWRIRVGAIRILYIVRKAATCAGMERVTACLNRIVNYIRKGLLLIWRMQRGPARLQHQDAQPRLAQLLRRRAAGDTRSDDNGIKSLRPHYARPCCHE